jgi:hypothetical protein
MRSHVGCTLVRGLAPAIGLALLPLACSSAGDATGESSTGSSAEASSGSCPVVITIPSQDEAVGQDIQLSVTQTCTGWTNAMRAYIDSVDCGSSSYPHPNTGCDTTGGAQNFSSSTWVQVTPGKHTLVVNNWDSAGGVSVSSPVTFTYTPRTGSDGGSDSGTGGDSGGGGDSGKDPVLVGAGDIAYGGGGALATGKELQTLVANNPGAMVFTLGDNAYGDSLCDEGGSPADYSKNYAPTAWSSLVSKTLPTPGNHEYNNCDLSDTVGPCIPSQGCGTLNGSSWVMAGYWPYFNGHAAVTPGGGTATTLHYSYDFTTTGGKKWHYVSLDSGMCFYTDNCSKGTSEYSWLANDLAAHTKASYDGGPYAGIVIGTHIDRWDSAGCPGGSGWMGDMFDLAYTYKVDLWLDGHVHGYERFAQLGQGCQSGETASGCGTFCGPKVDTNGPVLIDLGSGGADDWSGVTSHPLPGSITRIPSTYAVGRVRMHDASWDFTLYDTSNDVIDGPVTYAVH